MNPSWSTARWHALLRAGAFALAVAMPVTAPAAPGAHGPDGEHLDGPAQRGSAGTSPRLEAKSELFELVARLSGGELSILIDRYETNEPVLGATVEVESGALKARATFHADHGDYAISEPALLAALARPGQHALVFTVMAGQDADLLDGTLVVAAPAGPAQLARGHGHGHFELPRAASWGAGLFIAAALAFVVWRRREARIRGDRR